MPTEDEGRMQKVLTRKELQKITGEKEELLARLQMLQANEAALTARATENNVYVTITDRRTSGGYKDAKGRQLPEASSGVGDLWNNMKETRREAAVKSTATSSKDGPKVTLSSGKRWRGCGKVGSAAASV